MDCGDCTVCCTSTKVPELKKPERTKCKYCEKGCSIYDQRPQSCAEFECLYLKGGIDIRPDKCGVIIEDYSEFLFAMCYKDEWKTLHPQFKEYTEKGIPIVINTLFGNHMVLPENMKPEQVLEALQGVFNGRTNL